MVWAWNLVCGRFISFKKGRKFFDLIDFQLPQWPMRKNKKKLATFAKLLTVAFLFSVRQSIFLRWKLKISGYVFYGQDLMNFENVVVKFLRFFASQADYRHNTIVVPSQYHYSTVTIPLLYRHNIIITRVAEPSQKWHTFGSGAPLFMNMAPPPTPEQWRAEV